MAESVSEGQAAMVQYFKYENQWTPRNVLFGVSCGGRSWLMGGRLLVESARFWEARRYFCHSFFFKAAPGVRLENVEALGAGFEQDACVTPWQGSGGQAQGGGRGPVPGRSLCLF